eukprot:3624360-Pleurochrysis_carterae.AAC.1
MIGRVGAQGRECRCGSTQPPPPVPGGGSGRGGNGTTRATGALHPRLLGGAGGGDGRRGGRDGGTGRDGRVGGMRDARRGQTLDERRPPAPPNPLWVAPRPHSPLSLFALTRERAPPARAVTRGATGGVAGGAGGRVVRAAGQRVVAADGRAGGDSEHRGGPPRGGAGRGGDA